MVVTGHQFVQFVAAAVVRKELSSRVSEHGFVFTKTKVFRLFSHDRSYFDFGRPSTRSPKILRWTSLAPAAMVTPKLFM